MASLVPYLIAGAVALWVFFYLPAPASGLRGFLGRILQGAILGGAAWIITAAATGVL